jgi:DNA-binding PadR family transcriptional regulator
VSWKLADIRGSTGRGFGGRWTGRSDTDELRLALLSLLAEQPEAPMQGYHLKKRLEERSGEMYRASAGTVYPILQELEDEGLIVSQGGVPHRDGSARDRTTDRAGARDLRRALRELEELGRSQ